MRFEGQASGSVTAWDGGFVLAFREPAPRGEISLVRLGPDFRAAGPAVRLELAAPDASEGCEDPRLFVYGGQLHVAYVGVVGAGDAKRTNVLYARLAADFSVESIVAPRLAARRALERDWQFFEAEGALWAVYTVAPHRVMRIKDGEAIPAYVTDKPLPWNAGPLSGGASPVLVGDEFYCFAQAHRRINGVRVYNVAAYTFAARPPFAMQRMTAEPVAWADVGTKPADQDAAVIAPGGAVLGEGLWKVACGMHESWTEVLRFTQAEIEAALVRVGP